MVLLAPHSYGDWWAILWGYCSLRYFFFSPNLVWCAVAATVYYVFPYDYDAAAKLDRRFCLQRYVSHCFSVPEIAVTSGPA